jgi:multidrug efflux pump subunit AcrB
MSLAILLLGVTAIVTMPVDIFPYIDIPVVSVVWNYAGMSPSEMESRVLTVFERGMTTTVNDIEHIESQSYYGFSVVRVYFQPNVKIDMAVAQITAQSISVTRAMPPGIYPPSIIKYDASSVPILQLGLESKTLSEQEIFDLAQNFIRTPLATVQGASVPSPYGGKQRQVVVDLDPDAMYAKQLSPIDVSNAFSQQNLIVPAGTIKVGDTEYAVRINSSPEILSDLNNLPVKTVNGATVYLRDVATVRDGFSVQQNIVRTNGTRGALLTILRNGQASTLDIVNKVKAQLPRIEAAMPPELKIRQLFDQSLFVRASVNGVVREAAIAALLTGLMILLFLGSWRSTVIVCISIPLSILTSLIILNLMGHTINVMTLGGLALAVGILVDDATVERATNRDPGVCFHAFHLHCVRAGSAFDGRCQVSVYAARAGGGFRDARVLHAVAHPDSHHGALHAEDGSGYVSQRRARRRRNRRRPSPDLAHPFRFQSTIRALSRLLYGIARLGPRSSSRRSGHLPDFFVRLPRFGLSGGTGFLPHRGFRADSFARASAGWNAHRENGADLR